MSKSKTGLDRSGAQQLRHAKKYPYACPKCRNMTLLKNALYTYDSRGQITVVGCTPCMQEFFANEHKALIAASEAGN